MKPQLPQDLMMIHARRVHQHAPTRLKTLEQACPGQALSTGTITFQPSLVSYHPGLHVEQRFAIVK